MTDHGRFGDNGLGDGLHRHIANHRRGFVKIDARDIAHRPRCFRQGLLQRGEGPGDIVPRPFHARRRDDPAGNKRPRLRVVGRQRHLGGGVADINPGY